MGSISIRERCMGICIFNSYVYNNVSNCVLCTRVFAGSDDWLVYAFLLLFIATFSLLFYGSLLWILNSQLCEEFYLLP